MYIIFKLIIISFDKIINEIFTVATKMLFPESNLRRISERVSIIKSFALWSSETKLTIIYAVNLNNKLKLYSISSIK